MQCGTDQSLHGAPSGSAGLALHGFCAVTAQLAEAQGPTLKIRDSWHALKQAPQLGPRTHPLPS